MGFLGMASIAFFILCITAKYKPGIFVGISVIAIIATREIANSELFKSEKVLAATLMDDMSAIRLSLRANHTFEMVNSNIASEANGCGSLYDCNPKLNRSLPDWNKGKSLAQFGEASPFLLIADDAIGGFYLLNGGGLGKDLGKVYYFSPDNLTYEPLGITYSGFLQFCFSSDLEKFYKGLRWTKWKDEVSKLQGDKVFSFYPYLWSEEGKNIKKSTRNIVPIEEQYILNRDMRKQLGLDK
jgi:hypothetical protein